MPRIDYARKADDDFVGIAESIAHDKPEAARNWIARIREACEALARHPEMGEIRDGFGVPDSR